MGIGFHKTRIGPDDAGQMGGILYLQFPLEPGILWQEHPSRFIIVGLSLYPCVFTSLLPSRGIGHADEERSLPVERRQLQAEVALLACALIGGCHIA